jgi:hypothetical protein
LELLSQLSLVFDNCDEIKPATNLAVMQRLERQLQVIEEDTDKKSSARSRFGLPGIKFG